MIYENYFSCSGDAETIITSIKNCMLLAPNTEFVGETATEVYYRGLGALHLFRFRISGNRVYIDLMNFDGSAALVSTDYVDNVAPALKKITILTTPYLYLFHLTGLKGASNTIKTPLFTVILTTAGRQFILNNTNGKCSIDTIDNFNYSIEKIYFGYKSELEHYVLIPARIADDLEGKIIPEYPLGLYGVMAFPTDNSFYKFPDGSVGFYKSNLMFK